MRLLPSLCRGVVVALLLGSTPAMAADDIAARALKLYEKHHYEEAQRLLRPQLAGLDAASQPSAHLALGMICLRNAELYQALQAGAGEAELDYLDKLARQRKDGGRQVHYFLAEARLAAGKPAEASKQLQRYLGQSGISAGDKAQASILLGTAYWRLHQQARARATWAGVTVHSAETRAALADAYSEAGQQTQQALALADAAVAELKKQNRPAGARVARYLLRAYTRLGMPDKALDVLAAQEFREAAYTEAIGSSKTLSFYDADLLGSIAQANVNAAVTALEGVARDSKLAALAAYYLADAYLLQGNIALAQRQAVSFLALPQMPAAYREHARTVQAAAQYRAGRYQEAVAIWRDMTEQAASRPTLLAEVLQGCAAAGADCGPAAQRAVAAVESGEGRKYFALSGALGRYFLARRDYVRAAEYLEAGRDKANKNKIEANDPLLLAGLAQVYYRSKQFSESLEIYFEMSKQYPALRQVQDAVQGIYAVEQQSAGDVKIF